MQIAQNKKKLKKNLVINLLLLPLCIVLLILIFQIILSYERVFGFEIGPILLISIVILIFTIIILSSYSVVLSLKEYKAYFVHKSFNYSGRSRLTIQEIFDNENRRDIINAILEDPGIHNNELLRKSKINVLLSKGEGANRGIYEGLFSGNVIVSSYGNARIQKFDSGGNFLLEYMEYQKTIQSLQE